MIAVLGAGGVGGLLAGLLDRAGIAATVVAREPTAALIAGEGLAISSVRFGEFHASPRTVTRLEADHDVLIVATKAAGLEGALERITGSPGPRRPPAERSRPPRRAAGALRPPPPSPATIRVESDRPRPGLILHTSAFLRVEMASADRALRPALEAFAARLTAAGVEVGLGDSRGSGHVVEARPPERPGDHDERVRAPARRDPRRPGLADSARGRGRRGRGGRRRRRREDQPGAGDKQLAEDHPTLGSSMARDIAAGREPELDAIAGAVLRAADRHGVAVPVIEELVAEIVRRAGVSPPRRLADGDSALG